MTLVAHEAHLGAREASAPRGGKVARPASRARHAGDMPTAPATQLPHPGPAAEPTKGSNQARTASETSAGLGTEDTATSLPRSRPHPGPTVVNRERKPSAAPRATNGRSPGPLPDRRPW